MAVTLTRRDIGYTSVSRFEEAFRLFLSERLPSYYQDYFEGIPSGIVDKAKSRSAEARWDDIEDFLSNTDFPDLKEISCYKNQYGLFFSNINFAQQEFENTLDELYVLRCKIAHVQKHFSAFDLDKLVEFSCKIALQLGEQGKEYNDFVNILKEQPETITIPMPVDFSSSVPALFDIPNNLPIPDYEFEGGFVGRKDDIKKIIKLLQGNRNVITISGAGGVGKTALALRVAHTVLEKPDHGFDGVIWVSAKETKLSFLGIEDIEPTLRNYEELLETISKVMGFGTPNTTSIEKMQEDVGTIFNLYSHILLIIDNFETITDDRITNFILDIEDTYPNVKILVTSRRGLGQVERRHELTQLKLSEQQF